ncbi:uncharacterized protein METZ01_LOCUS386415 [marine metagenome]|uniref:Uncharacterized protein n=1 Tax=marine metagenome TaxID=408172 RepID=A0A382UIP0_9ZZZZ
MDLFVKLDAAQAQEERFDDPDEEDGENTHIRTVCENDAEPYRVEWPPGEAVVSEDE